MRKPCSSLTFDAILAALAVLSTTAACSKAERAGAEPASATPATTMTAAPTASAASPPPQAQPAVPPPAPAPTTAPSPDEIGNAKNAAIVDAGTERKPANGPAPKPTKGASAACGATGCSAEMRKGGK